MRINKSDAVIQTQVLNDHVFNKRGFARARLADDVNVMAAVFWLYAERATLFPKSSFAERFYFV